MVLHGIWASGLLGLDCLSVIWHVHVENLASSESIIYPSVRRPAGAGPMHPQCHCHSLSEAAPAPAVGRGSSELLSSESAATCAHALAEVTVIPGVAGPGLGGRRLPPLTGASRSGCARAASPSRPRARAALGAPRMWGPLAHWQNAILKIEPPKRHWHSESTPPPCTRSTRTLLRADGLSKTRSDRLSRLLAARVAKSPPDCRV
jgi:hypothetical protein